MKSNENNKELEEKFTKEFEKMKKDYELQEYEFKTIRDIVQQKTQYFDRLLATSHKTKNELFSLIHNLGLFFINEILFAIFSSVCRNVFP